MSHDNLPRKTCTKRAVHSAHSWWSRQHKRYFKCGGVKQQGAAS